MVPVTTSYTYLCVAYGPESQSLTGSRNWGPKVKSGLLAFPVQISGVQERTS